MTKQLEKLPFYISAASAIVVLVTCIAVGAQLYIMAAWVSLTIALFYIIGEFTRFFLVTKVFPPEEEIEEEETSGFFEAAGEAEESAEETEETEETAGETDGESAEEAVENDDEPFEDEEYENEPVEDAFLD